MELVKTLPARTRTYILAGGRGERLFPLTEDRPKPAVPFGGIFRIIDFTLSNCLNSGLSHVRLLTQHKYEQLHEHVSQSWGQRSENLPWDAAKQVICLPPASGKRYRGTADAVFQNLAVEEKLAEFTLVLSGDHIYHMDYRELLGQHAATGADLTIATIEHPVEDASRYGVIEVDGNFRVMGFEEKPPRPRPLPSNPARALISMGIYAFRTECLRQALADDADASDSHHDFAKDIIPRLVSSAKVYAYDFRDPVEQAPRYWRDIGTIDAYYESSMDLVSPNPPFDPFHTQQWPTPTPDSRSGRLRLGACLQGGRVRSSVLSPGVRIGEGAQVEGAVLMRGARIGKGARIRKAIIEEGIEIPAGTQIGFDIDEDRQRYFVSDTGVTVVGEPRRQAYPRRTTKRCARRSAPLALLA